MDMLMRSKQWAVVSVLALSAALVAPAASADNRSRGGDRGHVSQDRGSPHHDQRDRRDHRRHHNQRRDDRRSHGSYRSHHPRRHGHVDYRRTPVFYRGHTVPVHYRYAIQPLPVAYRYHVPAPPRGYRVGYYQGYSVVYDPGTFLILSVIDLLARQ